MRHLTAFHHVVFLPAFGDAIARGLRGFNGETQRLNARCSHFLILKFMRYCLAFTALAKDVRLGFAHQAIEFCVLFFANFRRCFSTGHQHSNQAYYEK